MADLGFRENVMGPQPIAQRKPIPQDLLDTVTTILALVAQGKGAELQAMAVESAKDETGRLASAVKAGSYDAQKVLATARTNDHYWVKAKLTGSDPKPFVFQLRLGQEGSRWVIWEATNLTDARSAWTK